VENGRAVVNREILKFRRGQYGQPWHFVDFSRGRGTAITNESAAMHLTNRMEYATLRATLEPANVHQSHRPDFQ
jgi:predicted ATPase